MNYPLFSKDGCFNHLKDNGNYLRTFILVAFVWADVLPTGQHFIAASTAGGHVSGAGNLLLHRATRTLLEAGERTLAAGYFVANLLTRMVAASQSFTTNLKQVNVYQLWALEASLFLKLVF